MMYKTNFNTTILFDPIQCYNNNGCYFTYSLLQFKYVPNSLIINIFSLKIPPPDNYDEIIKFSRQKLLRFTHYL